MAKRILVVDDEPGIVRILEECLKACGFEVRTALGGVEGLNMLEKWPFDGMTLGLVMPHMNGIEFLRQLRQRNQSLPVIIISGGYAQLTASEREFVKDKTQAVLTVPFTPADLTPILNKCFGVAS
ncbi:MAG: response regulator [Thermodesulfobacteriota bacterium]